MKKCLPLTHRWKDLGVFQYASLFLGFGRKVQVYRCERCGTKREGPPK